MHIAETVVNPLQLPEVQGVEGDFFYKTILVKTSFAVAFEFLNIGIEPDWFAEIKVVADLI